MDRDMSGNSATFKPFIMSLLRFYDDLAVTNVVIQ